jgi:predicted nucleotidyltransferase
MTNIIVGKTMIINRILDHIFINTSNLAVLRVLSERVTAISGRETARLAGISLRSAQIALANLQNLKIVNRQYGGREHLFSLNRNNFIASEIIVKLFSSEQKFKNSIFKEISKNLSPLTVSGIIFGSVARGEEYENSDLDICIVYNNNKNKIEKSISSLRDTLFTKYGVTLAPFYISQKDFKQRANKNKSPVIDIIRDGKVIFGNSIRELLNG